MMQERAAELQERFVEECDERSDGPACSLIADDDARLYGELEHDLMMGESVEQEADAEVAVEGAMHRLKRLSWLHQSEKHLQMKQHLWTLMQTWRKCRPKRQQRRALRIHRRIRTLTSAACLS